ncbi:MAG: 50S ribosomal protein L19 [Patescibacteria group bacterium]
MEEEQTQTTVATEETVTPVEQVESPAEPAKKAAASNILSIDQLRAGQTVRLHERIKDVSAKGEVRERVQVFEGIILGVKGAGVSKTLTIRKVSDGIGVEKIYPLHSPLIAKIELVKTARVRRAKLSFLNNLKTRFKRKLEETYVK